MKRVTFVTLGVRSLPAARAFYEKCFGWKPARQSVEGEVAFYDMDGWVFALFGREALAADAGVPARGGGFRGVALAHNVRTKRGVAAALERARRCGGKIVKRSGRAAWGGQTGYFSDPDGHLWEVAYNPFMPLSSDGKLHLRSRRRSRRGSR